MHPGHAPGGLAPTDMRPARADRTGLRIALLGAECTGKTALAQGLAEQLAAHTGWRCTWVPEWLRSWCDQHGRTPRPDEQHAIAQRQQALIDEAAASHALVVCDTTALMTAVYSRSLFGDTSLDDYAVAQQRHFDLTLLTALDLPWEPDGIQRDGPQVRSAVDQALRALMRAHALPWALVQGAGQARIDSALAAIAPLLGSPAVPPPGA